jgi:hypothetical protein
MPTTTYWGFVKPHPDDSPFDCGTSIVELADSFDVLIPRFSWGAPATPTGTVRNGDFYFQYSP